MSRRKLDLKLNLSLVPNRSFDSTQEVESPKMSSSSDEEMYSSKSPSSCVSSENSRGEAMSGYLSSPEATSMMLVGCPRCLMYVMVAETEPRCPQCKSSVLLNLEDKTLKKQS